VQTDSDLWYVADGSGEVQVDGAWHHFQAGDLLALAPGMRYTRERCGRRDPFRVYYAHIAPFGPHQREWDNVLAAAWPLKLALAHRLGIRDLFDRLFEAYTTAPPIRESLTVKGLTLQILDLVFDELRQVNEDTTANVHPAVLQARAFIDRYYRDPLNLADIASACGLSPSHLGFLFRTQCNLSPTEYLLRRRIRAARLLLARGAQAKAVAQDTGFGTPQYFSRVFKQRVGITPRAFARRSRRW